MTLGALVACFAASQQTSTLPTKWYAKAESATPRHGSPSDDLRLFSVRAERVRNRVMVRVCFDRDVALLKSRQAYFALNCEPGPTLVWNLKGPVCPTVPPIGSGQSAVLSKRAPFGGGGPQEENLAVAADVRSVKAVGRLIELSFDAPSLAEAVPYRATLYILPHGEAPGANIVRHRAGTAWFYVSDGSSFDLDGDWP